MGAAPRRTLILLLGLLAALGPLSFDMYLPALPAIQTELQASAAQVQLTLSAFLIGLACGNLIYGPLSDRYGRRPVLLGGLVLHTVTSLLCALHTGIDVLILFRFLNAVGGAAGMVLGRVIIRDHFPPRETAQMISLMAMIMLIGPMVSPMIGGQLLAFMGWRSIFVLLALTGLLALALTAFTLGESHPHERRNPLNLLTTLRAYTTILTDRRGLGFALCGGMSSGVVFTYVTSSPFVFINLYGVSPQHFGYLYGVIVAGLLICNFVNSRMILRARVHYLISTAHGIRLTVMTALLLLMHAGGGSTLPPLVLLLVPAVGVSAMIVPNITADMLHRFPTISGTASSVMGASTFGAGAVAGAVAGYLHDGTALPMLHTMAAFTLGSAAAYWLIAGSGAGSLGGDTPH